MAQRKLQQEVDRCFKRVAEGIQAFEGIYDKISQTENQSQKEKLEDALKREIKKLQRQRDQIKTWAASSEIKDKKPLLEQRKLIEQQMEKFKAVEKEMKTKAYSKEGLSGATKLDPREREKAEASNFVSQAVETLERQVEALEAESESLQVTTKKSKKDTQKTDRLSEIETRTETHKWHQGKLEQILRALENDGLDPEKVTDLKETIQYYLDSNQDIDFIEDDELYEDLSLEEESEGAANNDNDQGSSQDAQSIQDDTPEADVKSIGTAPGKPKSSSMSESGGPPARRPSTQSKSPLPALATLHNSQSAGSAATSSSNTVKPAPVPAKPPGETLKYASAAASATAGDKNSVGIAPLPPPPGAATNEPFATGSRSSAASSPVVHHVQPTKSAGTSRSVSQSHLKSPAARHSSMATASESSKESSVPPIKEKTDPLPKETLQPTSPPQKAPSRPAANERIANGDNVTQQPSSTEQDDLVFHLPPELQDLMQSFEAVKSRTANLDQQATQRMLSASHMNCPTPADSEKPRYNLPASTWQTPSYFPQEPLPVFEDPRLYTRLDTDTLFYIFYYRQGTYQQYLAAKALKNQSWRFHKQYQTWFQRHEEPKTITEEFEQGTYRFFDYESTWMNRRKADFRFAYKFLEDDL